MAWIKKFSEGSFSLFAGNTIEGFQPLDFYHFNPMWYDLWVDKIVEVMDKLDLDNLKFLEIKDILPTPSSMRAILVKMIPAYKAWKGENLENLKRVTNFVARMLVESCPKDPFALKSNPYHSDDEVKDIVDNLDWSGADIEKAREIGKLITSAGSLVHGLYNDVVTDLGWDVYGPYEVNLDGEKYSFLIRHFTDLSPEDLWPKELMGSNHEVVIYALYKDVEWEIAAVGCHTISKEGSPVQGMRKYVVVLNGDQIDNVQLKKLMEDSSDEAEKVYKEIRKMSFEEIKKKVLLQECYQLKKMFDAAGVDWKPTKGMISRIENKPLLENVIPHGKMVSSIEEYEEYFGIKMFASEVLKEEI